MFSFGSRLFAILVLLSLVSGCKLVVMVTAGGDVQSLSGTRDCAGGNVCEFETIEPTFTDTFTAVAKPGYQFVGWRNGGADFFCGDSVNPACGLTNSVLAGNAVFEALIASFNLYYIMPEFAFIGIDTDMDGVFDHLDDDDDNDGLLDGVDPCPLDPDPLCGAPVVLEQLLNTACWTVSADVGNAVAQSFIAPSTGILSHVGMAVEADGAATNLVILQGGPDGVTLHFQAISPPVISASPAAITHYALGLPVAVTAGQLYTIAVEDTGGFGLRFCGAATNPYAGGHAYQVEFFSATAFPNDDAAFSVTVQ